MIGLRPATPKDLEFTYLVKKRTLKEYVTQIWGWDENQQWKYHLEHFNPEKIEIIIKNYKKIGYFSVEDFSEKLWIDLIVILPEYQNKGIGTLLITNAIKRGVKENKNIELQVLKVNKRALRLYNSLGFVIKGETDTHFQLVFQKPKQK